MWWLGLLLLVAGASASPPYRLCVLPKTPSYYSAAQSCDKLGPTQIRCVIAVDRLDCMKKLNADQADFAVFEAEDLLLAADDKDLSDILITHRIHATEQKKWEFGVVALISNTANISKLSDLKGKRLCHPGNDPFSSVYDWSEIFSLYFENRVAPQVCEKDFSVEENRIKGLAKYFGESCKPGVWAADPDIDAALKNKYKNMCGLCDVPSLCSQRDKYWGRQGALYCLSDCLGDVAWSMLKDAKLHFSSVGVSVCSDVSLLCPDGSKMPLNSTEPCFWVTRPVPAIAVKRTKAEEIQIALREVLKMPDTPDDFIRLLESNSFTPPLELSPSMTPHDYLATAPGYLSANDMTICGQGSRAVNLCVSTIQDKIKCDWMAAVSRAYGLQPSLTCMYGANCLISVANKSADVTIVNTDILVPATRDHNLKPIMVQMPKQLKKSKTIAAVVKSDSKIKTFSDLKGKKACFSSVDGMGWSSFLLSMQKNDNFKGVCPYTKAMSNFFSEICVTDPSASASSYPNIKVCTAEYNGANSYEPGNLQASSNEIYDIYDAYDKETGAFQCLAVGGGDVAFISMESIPKFLEYMKGNNPEVEGLTVDSFRALCDPSVPNVCLLSWGSYSQVLVRNGIASSREEDVRSLFMGLNNLFGQHNTPSTRTFNMFTSTNSLFDYEDIADTEPAQRLELIDDFLKKAKQRPKNYELAIKSIETCSLSSSSHTSISPIVFLISIISIFFYKN